MVVFFLDNLGQEKTIVFLLCFRMEGVLEKNNN
jgi:hypothetical protein